MENDDGSQAMKPVYDIDADTKNRIKNLAERRL